MPAATGVSVLPLTVQMVVVSDVKVTGRPEDALAVSVKFVPNERVPGSVNEMVWSCLPANVIVT